MPQGPVASPRPAAPEPAEETAGTQAQASPGPSSPAPAARYAGSVSAPRRAAVAAATAGTIDIDERVPYFSKDIRRVVMTAAVMVVLIVVASLLLH